MRGITPTQAFIMTRPHRPSIRDAMNKGRAPVTPPTLEVDQPEPVIPASWQPVALEAEILGILDRPAPAGETLRAAYQQLEHELGSALSRLSVADARQLHQRLVSPRDNDMLAAKFRRLISERRDRLIAFLADAPRRAATAGRGRR